MSLTVEDWQIKLTGGISDARKHYETVLSENRELESKLILLASNEDAVLREQIEERAAIRYADGLSGDLLSAVESYMRRE